jgi:hypothetical protein
MINNKLINKKFSIFVKILLLLTLNNIFVDQKENIKYLIHNSILVLSVPDILLIHHDES